MKKLTIFAVTGIALQCGLAQEPFTYKPEDIPKNEIPEGSNAEEYIQKIYLERHYKIKVTFRAVDEDGKPIPSADINVGIDSLLHADGHNNHKGKTNEEGLFTVESRGRGCTDVVIEKDGYYPSRPEVKWDGDLNPGGEVMHENGGFRPWNPTVDVVLRKIGRPIPMRVWRGNTDGAHRAPDVGQEFGFDLFEKDWVKPHGKGKKADLLIKFESEFKDQNDYKISSSIRFTNPDDGLAPVPQLVSEESLLKYPREAPLDGYAVKELAIGKSSSGQVARIFAEQKEPIGYLLRFRSMKDKQTGKIVSAHYGKITRATEHSANVNPFEIDSYMWVNRELDKTPRFRFSFYLNPNLNDRNLEYDQETNLAPGAPQGVTWLP